MFALGLGLGPYEHRRSSAAAIPPIDLSTLTLVARYEAKDLTTMFQDDAASTPVTTVGQSIAVWRDKSGNNEHATQTNAALRPTYQLNALGQPCIRFDGTQYMNIPSLATIAGGVARTIGYSGLINASPTGSVAIINQVGSAGYLGRVSNVVRMAAAITTFNPTAMHVALGESDTVTTSIYVNSDAAASAATGTETGSRTFNIIGGLNTTSTFSGDISTIILRAAVSANQTERTGISKRLALDAGLVL